MREEIPAGWSLPALGDVTREEDERVGKGADPVVLSSTKHHGLVLSTRFFKKNVFSDDLSGYKVVRNGWFAYATNHLTEGSIGLLSDTTGSRCVSPVYTVFSCGPDVHPPYLFRLLKRPDSISRYKVYENASVDRRGAVKYADFARIPVALPPLAEQRKIADILDAADAIIRSTERLITKLEHKRRGIADSVFSAAAQTVRLGDYLTGIDAGSSPDLPDQSAGVDEWGVLKVNAVRPDGLHAAENRVVTKNSLIVRESEVQPGDLLMTRANTPQLVGLACYVADTRPGLMLSDKILRIVPTRSLDPEYASDVLALPSVRRQIETCGTGSSGSMKNISQEEIRELRIPWMPMSEQKRAVRTLGTISAWIRRERQELAKLRELKQGLLADLLTGKVRVDVDEAA